MSLNSYKIEVLFTTKEITKISYPSKTSKSLRKAKKNSFSIPEEIFMGTIYLKTLGVLCVL